MNCGLGEFTVPGGYRFSPSDEELLSDLVEKNQSGNNSIIPEIDVCKYEPRELPELAFKRTKDLMRRRFFFFYFWFRMEESWESQRKWFFFSPVDYKYLKSTRVNRTTREGSWKITGKDRPIKAPGNKAVIGMKRTLTFHLRGVPKPQRTGWVLHEYFLIREHSDSPKQVGEFVVCCLKYKSDNPDLDKDSPFRRDRGSSSCSVASNVENQAVPIHSANDDEAGTSAGMITQGEEDLAFNQLADELEVPFGNEGTQTDPCHIDENGLRTFVADQPDGCNFSDQEPLAENLDLLFYSPASPPPLDQLYQSPLCTTNVRNDESCKRTCPFEDSDPSLPKKNKTSSDDDDKLVSNTTSSSQNQAANVIPERSSQPGGNLESCFDTFLPNHYDYTLPSLIGGLGEFPLGNNFIEWDDLAPLTEGIDSFLSFSDTAVIDEGSGVTSDRNTEVAHGLITDYSASAIAGVTASPSNF